MDKELITQLNKFIGEASKATYASGGGKAEPWRKGFNELEYSDGDWYYRDSYTGFLRSWGQETVWYKDRPFWTALYGGGMAKDYANEEFAGKTFAFLKKVLSAGEKSQHFQPRGPETFQDDDWSYSCKVEGDIEHFRGSEAIKHKNAVVFTHEFIGGLVLD